MTALGEGNSNFLNEGNSNFFNEGNSNFLNEGNSNFFNEGNSNFFNEETVIMCWAIGQLWLHWRLSVESECIITISLNEVSHVYLMLLKGLNELIKKEWED